MFTETYREVLAPFLERYRKANAKNLRKGIIKHAAVAVQEHQKTLEHNEGGTLPNDIKMVYWCPLHPICTSLLTILSPGYCSVL